MKTVICPKCKEGREVTYQQKWNIAVGKSSGKCPCCKEGIDIKGLEKGHGWNKGIVGKKSHSYGQSHEGLWGENNPEWRGDDCSHSAHHQWLYRKLGKARKCEHCGFEGKCTWANLKNHEYHKDINDYISLCYSCHKLYDFGGIEL